MSSLTAGFSNDHPNRIAATVNRGALSSMIKNSFLISSKAVETIIPIFSSVAEGITHKMDKMASMGKGGQMANAQQGIGNDAVNKERKMRRLYTGTAFLFTKK